MRLDLAVFALDAAAARLALAPHEQYCKCLRFDSASWKNLTRILFLKASVAAQRGFLALTASLVDALRKRHSLNHPWRTNALRRGRTARVLS